MAESESEVELGRFFRLLPSRYLSGKVGRTITYYFSIEEEQWTVTISPDSCEVVKGKSVEEADCFLKTTKEILVKTYRGLYTPTLTDLMQGKIKTNRPDLLLTFKDVFDDKRSGEG